MASTEFYVTTDIETVECLLTGYIQDTEQDSWGSGPGKTRLIIADNYWWVAHTEPGREFALELQARRAGPDWQPMTPRLTLIARRTQAERIRVRLRYDDARTGEAGLLLGAMRRWWPGSEIGREATKRPGRPGLDRDELIYRLAKAQWAKEIRQKSGDNGERVYWKEICRQIGWRLGCRPSGVKLLEDARHRLHRLEKDDPDGLLKEVAALRKDWKEKRKM